MKQLLIQSFDLIHNFIQYIYNDVNNYILVNSDWLFVFLFICFASYVSYYVIRKIKDINYRFNWRIGGSLLVVTLALLFVYGENVDLSPITISNDFNINPEMRGNIVDLRGQMLGVQRLTYDTNVYLGDKGFLTIVWDSLIREDIFGFGVVVLLLAFIIDNIIKSLQVIIN